MVNLVLLLAMIWLWMAVLPFDRLDVNYLQVFKIEEVFECDRVMNSVVCSHI